MQRRRSALSSMHRGMSRASSVVVCRRVAIEYSVSVKLIAAERARSSEWVLVLEDAIDLEV